MECEAEGFLEVKIVLIYLLPVKILMTYLVLVFCRATTGMTLIEYE